MIQHGSKLAHYEVVSAIGRGGMGEVWRARDAKLGREVAIKTLPDEFAADPDLLARFEREARLLASLNHPNIAAIHGLEEYEGTQFLVLELVEGATLFDRIHQGAVPVEESLRLATEIAEALEAAHGKGVIHRDLKPANIKMTLDGKVKVLDFGLAKAVAGGAGDSRVSQSPTISIAATRQGLILGTAAYMSPEQARGHEVDQRTDIWAFGCVLYEMLTGRRAFAGEDTADVLVRIMRDEPDWNALERVAAGPVERLVRRCLRKDRSRRYQHIGDVRLDLEDAAADPARQRNVPPDSGSRSLRSATALGVAAGVVLAGLLVPIASLLGWIRWGGEGALPPPILHRQITSQPAELAVWGAAVSPDGTYVAYSDPTGLYLEIVETGESNVIPVSADLDFAELAWTPDGTRIIATGWSSLTATTSVYSIPVIGGRPQRLADGWRAAVSPDGGRIAYLDPVWPTRAIHVMDADGDNRRTVVRAAEGQQFIQLAWSPDGRRLALGTLGLGLLPSIQSVPVDGNGEPATLVADPRLFMNWRGTLPFRWLPDGRLVYTMQEATPNEGSSNLWVVDTDPGRGVATGDPARLTDTLGSSVRDIRTSADGRVLSMLRERNQADVYIAALGDGGRTFTGEPERLTLDERDDQPSDWTPDGGGILFTSYRGNNSWDIYRQDIGSRVADLLVSDPAPLHRPTLTPDGSGILYARWDARPQMAEFRGVMLAPFGGTAEGPARSLLESDVIRKFDCARSRCIVSRVAGQDAVFQELDPRDGPGADLARTTVDFADPNFVSWALSPDGTEIVITNFGGSLRMLDLDDGAERTYETAGWTALETVTWTSDGTGVLVAGIAENGPRLNNQALLHVDVGGAGETTVVRHVVNEWHTYPRVSPDGTLLAFGLMKLESNVWVIEGF